MEYFFLISNKNIITATTIIKTEKSCKHYIILFYIQFTRRSIILNKKKKDEEPVSSSRGLKKICDVKNVDDVCKIKVSREKNYCIQMFVNSQKNIYSECILLKSI